VMLLEKPSKRSVWLLQGWRCSPRIAAEESNKSWVIANHFVYMGGFLQAVLFGP
jgi:hypothetical protein